MPLIVISGFPSSGKSTLAKRLSDHLTTSPLDTCVEIVSEEAVINSVLVNDNENDRHTKNTVFQDSQLEKRVRGELMTEVVRLLSDSRVVILDALNYIKGFRYELHCACKAHKSTQCTIHCDVSGEDAWNWNVNRTGESIKYSREVFDGLVQRFEPPNGNNRWDSPLLYNLVHLPLDMNAVCNAIFKGKKVKANKSTLQCNTSITSQKMTDLLESVTQTTIDTILSAVQNNDNYENDSVTVPNSDIPVLLRENESYGGGGGGSLTHPTLMRIKRQFINYYTQSKRLISSEESDRDDRLNRMSSETEKITSMFVQFINKYSGE